MRKILFPFLSVRYLSQFRVATFIVLWQLPVSSQFCVATPGIFHSSMLQLPVFSTVPCCNSWCLLWLCVATHGIFHSSMLQLPVSFIVLCLVMSTIPKRKHIRSDIGAEKRNETKTFWCVPKFVKTKAELFHLFPKL
jgi:hypothetical protein